MGLIRLLLFLFIAWLIWWLVRPLFRSDSETRERKPRGGVENMVRCAHCGLNLPEQEALRDGDNYYCSEEHRQLGRHRE
jgi:uncharacterized protein